MFIIFSSAPSIKASFSFNNGVTNLSAYSLVDQVGTYETVGTSSEGRYVILYAMWTPITYSVTLDLQDSSNISTALLYDKTLTADNYIKFVFEGIEYTVASNNLSLQELLNVSASYMQVENK